MVFDELNSALPEYELYNEFNALHKIIKHKGKKYIFNEPPAEVRPVFSPAPIVSTVSEANRQKTQIREFIKARKLNERRILRLMGCLNMYIYLTAKDWKAIKKNSQKDSATQEHKYEIDSERLSEMIAIADQGNLENAFPSTYAVEYLKKYWGISCAKRSYYGVREFCRNYLLLFDFNPGEYQTRKIPRFRQINYRRLLLTYEVLEEELNEREKCDLLPEHLGSNVVKIYNAVFLGFLRYRSKWRFDLGAVICEDEMQRPINREIEKPSIREFGNKSWSDITKKVLDQNTQSWVPYFKTKDERDAYLARQQK
ncbi:hypothetical protein H6G41_33670 [Tolypothrix sp. FACHB-123]|uniref:hypothetical protein n=1 Tax=Tolypothrix sp. FACHB-123 TaxID=2692868 RepID=UPI001688B21D|nr:hypothetical protein [Tolypothrix sp. FACHB-123]MBD2359464.1 hypothetical protein [Tolypothrix sp. FACHB-123]